MNQTRFCGCKGYRSCLLCESQYGIVKSNELDIKHESYVYCPFCKDKAWPGWNINSYNEHPNHEGTSITYTGVYLQLDFINENEENGLIEKIDEFPWDLSQSGRRKQNFGPKCNFKKRKLRLDNFNGFPQFTKFLQDRFSRISLLDKYQTIEQCALEYTPERGSSIDPHVDDCWIWGERIITISLLSDSMLTMTYNRKPDGYNLDYISKFKSNINLMESSQVGGLANYPIVRIPMPRRSILVLYGEARYEWEHRILREDITDRRLCLTYREFTPPYLCGGENEDDGVEILNKAKNFWT